MCLKNSKHQWLHSQQWLKLANSRPLLLHEGGSLDHLRRASWASTSSFVAGPWDEAAVTINSVALRARHQGPAESSWGQSLWGALGSALKGFARLSASLQESLEHVYPQWPTSQIA